MHVYEWYTSSYTYNCALYEHMCVRVCDLQPKCARAPQQCSVWMEEHTRNTPQVHNTHMPRTQRHTTQKRPLNTTPLEEAKHTHTHTLHTPHNTHTANPAG